MLEFQESKKVVSVDTSDVVTPPPDLLDVLEQELKKLNGTIKLVLEHDPDINYSRQFLLQRYSSEWREFVDVVDIIEVDNGDHLKAPIGSQCKGTYCLYLSYSSQPHHVLTIIIY